MPGTYVVFRVGPHRLGVPLDRVERVIAAVAVTPLPAAPEVVLGVIDIARDIVPVCDVHRRLGLPRGPVTAADRFVVARSTRRRMVLKADEVVGLAELAPDAAASAAAVPAPVSVHLSGIAAAPDGIVLIEDLDRFLSLDEETRLEAAIDQQGAEHGGIVAGAGA